MLESEPNNISLKYLVATSMLRNPIGKNMTVQQTAMMPHIHAFGPLMAAIFCPTMELARDKSKSHYISMITGSGYDEATKRRIFDDNDVKFDLDAEITAEDLKNVINLSFLEPSAKVLSSRDFHLSGKCDPLLHGFIALHWSRPKACHWFQWCNQERFDEENSWIDLQVSSAFTLFPLNQIETSWIYNIFTF